jgi:hypothetical protein
LSRLTGTFGDQEKAWKESSWLPASYFDVGGRGEEVRKGKMYQEICF